MEGYKDTKCTISLILSQVDYRNHIKLEHFLLAYKKLYMVFYIKNCISIEYNLINVVRKSIRGST